MNYEFSFEEITARIKRLKNYKAVGAALIPNEVLKQRCIINVLLNFTNICFLNKIMPSVWQKALISPIPKSSLKDPHVPLNYRGISLISCVYKLYSSLINERLKCHLEHNDLLVDEQNGFRPNRSCIEHVHTLTTVVRNRMSHNLPTFTAFIDMRKAFDWVDRDLLLFKIMSQFDIKGTMYNAIKSLYINLQCSVKLNNFNTQWFPISSGVKQGGTLSPTFFKMFLNDVQLKLKS